MTARARPCTTRLNLLATPGSACNYLPGEQSSTLFVDPHFRLDVDTYSLLSAQGFRRSGEYLYRPHCRHCQACIPVRIPVNHFRPNRNQRRNRQRNAELAVEVQPARFRREHFMLYQRYLQARHPEGGMDDPEPSRYMEFLTSQWCDTEFIEFRQDGQLLMVAVIDCLNDGLSAVYTFFEPHLSCRSLGRFGVLTEIELASRRGLQWLYLGYWIAACRKMNYKEEYQPLQYFYGGQWQEQAPARH